MLSRWAPHSLSKSVSLPPAERKEAFLDNYSPREPKDWLCLLSVFSYNTWSAEIFLASRFLCPPAPFLFLVAGIGKMSELPINRALGHFNIVKGMFLHVHDCWILGIRNSVRPDRWKPGSGLTSGLHCSCLRPPLHLLGAPSPSSDSPHLHLVF